VLKPALAYYGTKVPETEMQILLPSDKSDGNKKKLAVTLLSPVTLKRLNNPETTFMLPLASANGQELSTHHPGALAPLSFLP